MFVFVICNFLIASTNTKLHSIRGRLQSYPVFLGLRLQHSLM